MIDFKVTLGAQVTLGETLADVWEVGSVGRAPYQIITQRPGILTARHHPGLVQPGDCVAVLALETG